MTVTAKSKYIIGADGGKSSVRNIAGIPFIGEKSAFQWVRIDAVIKTDMPQSRGASVRSNPPRMVTTVLGMECKISERELCSIYAPHT